MNLDIVDPYDPEAFAVTFNFEYPATAIPHDATAEFELLSIAIETVPIVGMTDAGTVIVKSIEEAVPT